MSDIPSTGTLTPLEISMFSTIPVLILLTLGYLVYKKYFKIKCTKQPVPEDTDILPLENVTTD